MKTDCYPRVWLKYRWGLMWVLTALLIAGPVYTDRVASALDFQFGGSARPRLLVNQESTRSRGPTTNPRWWGAGHHGHDLNLPADRYSPGFDSDFAADTPPDHAMAVEQGFRRYANFNLYSRLKFTRLNFDQPPRDAFENGIPALDPIAPSSVIDATFKVLEFGWGEHKNAGMMLGFGYRFFEIGRDGGYSQDEIMADIAGAALTTLAKYQDQFPNTQYTPQQAGDMVYAAILAYGKDRNQAMQYAQAAALSWQGNQGGADATFGSRYAEGQISIAPIAFEYAISDSFSVRAMSQHRPSDNPWVLDPAFDELIRALISLEDTDPNDPLYRKGSAMEKVASTAKKSIGFALKLFGSPIESDTDGADDQWGLHAVGYTPKGQGTSAWDREDGMDANVIVAVIDSGLDLAHKDGPEHLWQNPDEIPDNGIDDDGNGYVDDIHGWNFIAENNDVRDDYGHGTFVTGIIAANTNNAEGIAGINPGARIMVLKASNQNGKAHDLAVYRAVRYAVDNGARVINISLGGEGRSRLLQIGLNYAYGMGALVVVAAGNWGNDIAGYEPQNARRVVSVASMDMDGTRRSASNKGLNVAMAAPGESIYSLSSRRGKRDGQMLPITPTDYHRLNGTSFAAPFVAGTASLIWARNPDLTNREVEDLLLYTAHDIGSSGWDDESGAGRLDAYGALSQDQKTIILPRISEILVNRQKKKIASVDIYGSVRGHLENFIVEVGRGAEPDNWQTVFGPSKYEIDNGFICRIDGKYFQKGSNWSVRIVAVSPDGESRTQQVLVAKK
ncbi:MAG: S8 family peptidase [Desulfobacterales bacterium]|nr:S8 family peptidase [Desulfobacterales bacterium]